MKQHVIDKNEVIHISELCKLQLSEEEINKLTLMLGDTVGYINILNELDTSNTSETYQITGLTNVFQLQDANSNSLSVNEALSNANEVIDNKFATDAVFDR